MPLHMLSNAAKLAHCDADGRLLVSDEYYRGINTTMKIVIEYLGDIPISSIDEELYSHLMRCIEGRESAKAITRNSYKGNVKATFNKLYKKGLLDFSPLPLTIAEKVKPLRPRSVSPRKIKRLIQLCSTRDSAMILFALGTGIRRQTIPRVMTSETKIWQSEDGEFRLASSIPAEKTSHPRIVFAKGLPALAVYTWLQLRMHDSVYVFNHYDSAKQISASLPSNIWVDACARAGMREEMRGAAWHRLRHMYSQARLDENHDVALIAKWMGITPQMVLAVYAQPDESRSANAFFGEELEDSTIHDLLR